MAEAPAEKEEGRRNPRGRNRSLRRKPGPKEERLGLKRGGAASCGKSLFTGLCGRG